MHNTSHTAQLQLKSMQEGNTKSLARLITIVENELEGYYDILSALPSSNVKITGITGPPGAGKSTLTDALIGEWVNQDKKVAVLCVDPSSPFNHGALLGDRIRMSDWYNHPAVFIRSMASRGSLGGLNPAIMEVADLMRAAWFDHIIIETVGVGQSEVEIAGIADTTIVVLTPEGGDEVQTMKAGLMEIADVFVVNKADRPGADAFVKNLRNAIMFYERLHTADIEVVKTEALSKKGISELTEAISKQQLQMASSEYKYALLTEKAFKLIEKQRMKSVEKLRLRNELINEAGEDFNLYRFVRRYFN